MQTCHTRVGTGLLVVNVESQVVMIDNDRSMTLSALALVTKMYLLSYKVAVKPGAVTEPTYII